MNQCHDFNFGQLEGAVIFEKKAWDSDIPFQKACHKDSFYLLLCIRLYAHPIPFLPMVDKLGYFMIR